MRTGSAHFLTRCMPLLAALFTAAQASIGCDTAEPAPVTPREVEHILITQADIDELSPGESLRVDLGAERVVYHFQLEPLLDFARILLLSADDREGTMDVAVAAMQARLIDPLAASDDRLVLTGDPANFVELSPADLEVLRRDGALVLDAAGQPQPKPQTVDECDPSMHYSDATFPLKGVPFGMWSMMRVLDCGVCEPLTMVACYTGTPSTEGVGPCHGGRKTCNPNGSGYGPCWGQVVPQPEICLDAEDRDCSGDPGCGEGFLWAKRFGDTSSQSGLAVIGDAAGNVFVTGKMGGTVDFGAGPLASAGSQDAFLVKLDSAGNTLWGKRFGGLGFESGDAVAVDAAGNVVVTGILASSADFGGGALTSAGSYDVFVAKFDPTGALLWANRYGDNVAQWASDIGVDGTGNIVLTGTFLGTVDFGAGPLTNPSPVANVFLAKLDPNGSAIWSQQFGPSSADVTDLGVGAGGTIAIIGSMWSTVDFGSGPLTSAGGSDGFVAVFDANGGALWSKRFGSVNDDSGHGVAVDGADVALTGRFLGAIDLGAGPIVSTTERGFAAKLDATGNLVWAQAFPAFAVSGNDVVVDAAHNVVLTGIYKGNGSFGDRTLTTYELRLWSRFLLKLDQNGGLLWSKGFPITSSWDDRGLGIDGSGHVLYTGILLGTTDYGGGPLTAAGWSYDIVVARFDP